MSGLYYGLQTVTTPINNVTLTASYGVADKTIIVPIGKMSNLTLFIQYARGAAEASSLIEIRVRASHDGVTFYSIANESISSGVSTLTPRVFQFGPGNMSLPLDSTYKFVELSLREVTVTTNFGTASMAVMTNGI